MAVVQQIEDAQGECFATGRHDEDHGFHIPEAKQKNDIPGGGDLRGDLRRDGVLARVGLSPDMTYDQMCEVVGGVKAAELLLASEAEPSAADVTSDVKPVTRDDG